MTNDAHLQGPQLTHFQTLTERKRKHTTKPALLWAYIAGIIFLVANKRVFLFCPFFSMIHGSNN